MIATLNPKKEFYRMRLERLQNDAPEQRCVGSLPWLRNRGWCNCHFYAQGFRAAAMPYATHWRSRIVVSSDREPAMRFVSKACVRHIDADPAGKVDFLYPYIDPRMARRV